MYYSYHNKIKSLIREGHFTEYKIVEKWNSITPALVLFFDNHKPMPIRDNKWEEYFLLLNDKKSINKI